MAEVQQHGLKFEHLLIYIITGLSVEEYKKYYYSTYTALMDIVPGPWHNLSYSIKTTGGETVCCGDINRFINHISDTPFIMIAGQWAQPNKTQKHINCIYEITFQPPMIKLLLGYINLEKLKLLIAYVKSIPHGKDAQLKHRPVWKKMLRELYADQKKGIIKINVKVDSGSQRRVQCSFKIANIIAAFPESVTKYVTNYKGIALPYVIDSSPRTFEKT